MPFNGTGTFVRLENWTNDANNNLPISATKFDIEDNDFASGLSLCLTRDGQGGPSAPLTWVQPLTINRATDGTGIAVGRTGGVNNPAVQLTVADATGAALNLSTAQMLSLAIAGTNVISVAAAAITLAQPTTLTTGDFTLPNATAAAPSLNFAASAASGFYSVGASDIGISIAGVQAVDIQANQLAAVGAAGVAASLVVAGNGVAIANGLTMRSSAAGLAQFLLAGAEICNINANAQWTWDAPTAGGQSGFTFNGRNGNNAALFATGVGAGTAFGVQIKAGTNSSDYALLVTDQTGVTTYFKALGDGCCFIQEPPQGTTGVATGTHQVGYLDIPQNAQGASYTLVATDRGKHVIESLSGSTVTIPANSVTAFPVGTAITVINTSGGNVTLAINTDVLSWSPSGTTGNRTLASRAVATILKISSNIWILTGVGIT